MPGSFSTNRLIKLGLIVLPLIGVVLILLRTVRDGAVLYDDSVSYLSIARNLAAGHGYQEFAAVYMTPSAPDWPPLLPGLLALGALCGVDPVIGFRVLNALCFGGIVLLIGLWLRSRGASPDAVLLGMLAAVLAAPVSNNAICGLSESLFALLTLLCLLYLWAPSPTRGLHWLLAAVFAALACLTRYIGVTLILSGVTLAAGSQSTTIRLRATRALRFACTAALPLALWLARNRLVSGTLMGERRPSTHSLTGTISFVADTVCHWVLPQRAHGPVWIGGFLAGIALILLLSVAALRRCAPDRLRTVLPPTIFVAIYTTFLVISLARINYAMDERMMMPIYMPIVLVLVYIADSIRQTSATTAQAGAMTVVAGAPVAILLIVSLLSSARYTLADIHSGTGKGYASAAWRTSPMIDYLRHHPQTGFIYCNAPEAYYLHVNQDIHIPPSNGIYNMPSELLAQHLADFRKRVATLPEVKLIWFTQEQRPYLYTPQDLSTKLNVSFQLLAETTDGMLYRVTTVH